MQTEPMGGLSLGMTNGSRNLTSMQLRPFLLDMRRKGLWSLEFGVMPLTLDPSPRKRGEGSLMRVGV